VFISVLRAKGLFFVIKTSSIFHEFIMKRSLNFHIVFMPMSQLFGFIVLIRVLKNNFLLTAVSVFFPILFKIQ